MLEKYILLSFVPILVQVIKLLKSRVSLALLSTFTVFIFTSALVFLWSNIILTEIELTFVSIYTILIIYFGNTRNKEDEILKILYTIWFVNVGLISQFEFFEMIIFLFPYFFASNSIKNQLYQFFIYTTVMMFVVMQSHLPSIYQSSVDELIFVLLLGSAFVHFRVSASILDYFVYQIVFTKALDSLGEISPFIYILLFAMSLLAIFRNHFFKNLSVAIFLGSVLSISIIENFNLLSREFLVFQFFFLMTLLVEHKIENKVIIRLVLTTCLFPVLYYFSLVNEISNSLYVVMNVFLIALYLKSLYVRNIIPDSYNQLKQV